MLKTTNRVTVVIVVIHSYLELESVCIEVVLNLELHFVLKLFALFTEIGAVFFIERLSVIFLT